MKEPIIPPTPKPAGSSTFSVPKAVGTQAVSQATLIIKAHGLNYIKPLLFQIPNAEKLAKERDAYDEGMKNRKHGEFGVPIFDVLTFSKKDWTTLDGQQLSVPELSLGIALVEVSQSKNIVRTAIQ